MSESRTGSTPGTRRRRRAAGLAIALLALLPVGCAGGNDAPTAAGPPAADTEVGTATDGTAALAGVTFDVRRDPG